LKKHEDEIVKQKHGSAVVVMKSGEVYRVDGAKNRVYPDYVFEDELIGSSITHNHLIEETTFFFSDDDSALFEHFKLRLLRQVDEQYASVLDRDSEVVEPIDFNPRESKDFEQYWNSKLSKRAKDGAYGYKRHKK